MPDDYLPYPKDGEGKVLTGVCVSVHRRVPTFRLMGGGLPTFQVMGVMYLPSSQWGVPTFQPIGGTYLPADG